jgi:hypothetical protein
MHIPILRRIQDTGCRIQGMAPGFAFLLYPVSCIGLNFLHHFIAVEVA